MNRELLQNYCISRKGATAEQPFGAGITVYKVMGKMFALVPEDDSELSVSLKCDPVWAQVLRQTYKAITPGYHLNKQHWNTVVIDDSISDEEIYEMIDHSYELVVKNLKKMDRARLSDL